MAAVLTVVGIVLGASVTATGALLLARYQRRNQVTDATAAAAAQETAAGKELKIEEARFLVEQWQRLHGEQATEIRSLRDDLEGERARVTVAFEKHAECEAKLQEVLREQGVMRRQLRDAGRSLGDDGVV